MESTEDDDNSSDTSDANTRTSSTAQLANINRDYLTNSELKDFSNLILLKIVEQIFTQPFQSVGLKIQDSLNSLTRIFDTGGRVFNLFVIWQIGVFNSFFVSDNETEAFWNDLHCQMAKSVWKDIVELRGFWIKIGQYFSTTCNKLPEQYIRVLSRLQDDIPGEKPNVVLNLLNKIYGDISSVFSHFNLEYIASASVAQVHFAKLINGDRVVVKILHENLDKILAYDSAMFDSIRWALDSSVTGSIIGQVFDEWKSLTVYELDLNNELHNITKGLECLNKTTYDIIIPKPYPQYSCKDALVMEYIDGIKVTDREKIAASNININKCIIEIVDYFFYHIFIVGFFHADPHPGNLMFVKRDGEWKLALIDWGYVKTFTPVETYFLSKMVVYTLESETMGSLYSYISLGAEFNDAENMSVERKRKSFDPNFLFDCVRSLVVDFSFEDYEEPDSEGEMAQTRKGGTKFQTKAHSLKEEDQYESQAYRITRIYNKNIFKAAPDCLVVWSRTVSLLRNLIITSNLTVPFISLVVYWCKFKCKMQHLPKRVYYIPTNDLEILIYRTLQSLLQSKFIIGCQVSIQFDPKYYSKKHSNIFLGTRGKYDRRFVDNDTLFNIYSASKAFLSAAILNASTLGLIDLDSPVKNYWPRFAHRSSIKREFYQEKSNVDDDKFKPITIRDVLNHKIGGDQFVSDIYMYDLLNFDFMCNIIADAYSWTRPDVEYSHIAFGYILSKILFDVKGESHEHFINGLEIPGIRFYTDKNMYPAVKRQQLCSVYEFFYRKIIKPKEEPEVHKPDFSTVCYNSLSGPSIDDYIKTKSQNIVNTLVGDIENEEQKDSSSVGSDVTYNIDYSPSSSCATSDYEGEMPTIEISDKELQAMLGLDEDINNKSVDEIMDRIREGLPCPSSVDAIPRQIKGGNTTGTGSFPEEQTGKEDEAEGMREIFPVITTSIAHNLMKPIIENESDCDKFYYNLTSTEFLSSDAHAFDDHFSAKLFQFNSLTRPDRSVKLRKKLSCVNCSNDVVSFENCLERRCILMDPRMFDHFQCSQLFVPGLNCHASASGLSEFYIKLPEIISEKFIDEIVNTEKQKNIQTLYRYKFTGVNSTCWALGFQVYEFRQISTGKIYCGIGHSDITGTIGLYIPHLHISIAITQNTITYGQFVCDVLMYTIANYFDLEPLWFTDETRLNTISQMIMLSYMRG